MNRPESDLEPWQWPEDHWRKLVGRVRAGRKLRRSIDALTRVLAIELMTAARALDLRAPVAPAPATAAAVRALRDTVPGPGADRFLSVEIESAVELVRTGVVVRSVEAVTGALE